MKKSILEVQWDSNWDKSQKIVCSILIQVKKVKVYRDTLFRWLLPIKRPGKIIHGTIIRSDIDLVEKKLLLILPDPNMKEVYEGDILDLTISDRGWCIAMERHDVN